MNSFIPILANVVLVSIEFLATNDRVVIGAYVAHFALLIFYLRMRFRMQADIEFNSFLSEVKNVLKENHEARKRGREV